MGEARSDDEIRADLTADFARGATAATSTALTRVRERLMADVEPLLADRAALARRLAEAEARIERVEQVRQAWTETFDTGQGHYESRQMLAACRDDLAAALAAPSPSPTNQQGAER